MGHRPRRAIVAVVLFLAVWSAAAPASGLSAAPVRLEFAADRKVQQLRIGNTGRDNMVVQIELFRWSQPEGEDRLEPSRDFLVTPPILEIAASAHRIVRVGPRAASPDVCEASYRLVITEIPQRNKDEPPLRFRTRMRLPLFHRQSADCRFDLRWRRQDGVLVVSNAGLAHGQLQSVNLVQGERNWLLKLKNVGYVLPGARQQFELPADLSGDRFKVEYMARGQGQETVILPPR